MTYPHDYQLAGKRRRRSRSKSRRHSSTRKRSGRKRSSRRSPTRRRSKRRSSKCNRKMSLRSCNRRSKGSRKCSWVKRKSRGRGKHKGYCKRGGSQVPAVQGNVYASWPVPLWQTYIGKGITEMTLPNFCKDATGNECTLIVSYGSFKINDTPFENFAKGNFDDSWKGIDCGGGLQGELDNHPSKPPSDFIKLNNNIVFLTAGDYSARVAYIKTMNDHYGYYNIETPPSIYALNPDFETKLTALSICNMVYKNLLHEQKAIAMFSGSTDVHVITFIKGSPSNEAINFDVKMTRFVGNKTKKGEFTKQVHNENDEYEVLILGGAMFYMLPADSAKKWMLLQPGHMGNQLSNGNYVDPKSIILTILNNKKIELETELVNKDETEAKKKIDKTMNKLVPFLNEYNGQMPLPNVKNIMFTNSNTTKAGEYEKFDNNFEIKAKEQILDGKVAAFVTTGTKKEEDDDEDDGLPHNFI